MQILSWKKKWSKNVLLTRGSDGLSIIENKKINHLKAKTQEVFDVTGAGDTVIALFSAALAASFSTLEAANFANLGASIVVKKSGTLFNYKNRSHFIKPTTKRRNKRLAAIFSQRLESKKSK